MLSLLTASVQHAAGKRAEHVRSAAVCSTPKHVTIIFLKSVKYQAKQSTEAQLHPPLRHLCTAHLLGSTPPSPYHRPIVVSQALTGEEPRSATQPKKAQGKQLPHLYEKAHFLKLFSAVASLPPLGLSRQQQKGQKGEEEESWKGEERELGQNWTALSPFGLSVSFSFSAA